MRCLSCGLMNAPHALECTSCKKILDPIAAAVTVGVASDPLVASVQVAAPAANGVPSRPPLPELDSLTGMPVTAVRKTSNRRGKVDVEVDFLVDPKDSRRLVELTSPKSSIEHLPRFDVITKCPRCGKKVESVNMVLALQGKHERICQECQARLASKEEAAPVRRDIYRQLAGAVAGLVAGIVIMSFARQFAIIENRTINWPITLAVGAIIGLVVRLGALNRTGPLLQWFSLLIALGTVAASLWNCLSFLNNNVLALNLEAVTGALDKLNPAPGLMDYAFVALSLLIAFVIPSSIFGGSKAEE